MIEIPLSNDIKMRFVVEARRIVDYDLPHLQSTFLELREPGFYGYDALQDTIKDESLWSP